MQEAFHLYVISFTVGAESGLAMVAAQDEKSAFQILKNGGSRHSEGYSLIQCRDIGMTAGCHYGLLMESFVNALEAYDAISKIADSIQGPEGPKGEKGDKGDRGEAPFGAVNVTVDRLSGNPSATTRIIRNSSDVRTLNIDFKGLKGENGTSITNITQTALSAQDDGNNEITVTLSDGRTSKFYVRNGSTGVQDVQVYLDPNPGNPRVVKDFEDGILTMTLYGLKGADGEPGISNTTIQLLDDITDRPVASEETASIIYFVYNEDTGEYDRYFTTFDGTNYDYVQAGSATINLSDYERKDSNVWLTREEFDALEIKDNTKTYNIYEEEMDSSSSSTDETEESA